MRRLLVLLSMCAPLFLVPASASTLPTTSSVLGSGGAPVERCQSAPFTYDGIVDAQGQVTAVSVGNIELPCRAVPNTLELVLLNSYDQALATGSANDVTTSSVVVAVSPEPPRTDVAGVAVVVEAP